MALSVCAHGILLHVPFTILFRRFSNAGSIFTSDKIFHRTLSIDACESALPANFTARQHILTFHKFYRSLLGMPGDQKMRLRFRRKCPYGKHAGSFASDVQPATNPATMESPAPTALTSVPFGAGCICTSPFSAVRTAPCPAMETRTFRAPFPEAFWRKGRLPLL